jgi:hypothetical protein
LLYRIFFTRTVSTSLENALLCFPINSTSRDRKDKLNFKELKHVLIENADQLLLDMLSRPPYGMKGTRA